MMRFIPDHEGWEPCKAYRVVVDGRDVGHVVYGRVFAFAGKCWNLRTPDFGWEAGFPTRADAAAALLTFYDRLQVA